MKNKKLKKKFKKKLNKKLDRVIDDVIDGAIAGFAKEFEKAPGGKQESEAMDTVSFGPDRFREAIKGLQTYANEGLGSVRQSDATEGGDCTENGNPQVEKLKEAFSVVKEHVGNTISSVAESEKVSDLKDTLSKCADSAANTSADVLEKIASKIRK